MISTDPLQQMTKSEFEDVVLRLLETEGVTDITQMNVEGSLDLVCIGKRGSSQILVGTKHHDGKRLRRDNFYQYLLELDSLITDAETVVLITSFHVPQKLRNDLSAQISGSGFRPSIRIVDRRELLRFIKADESPKIFSLNPLLSLGRFERIGSLTSIAAIIMSLLIVVNSSRSLFIRPSLPQRIEKVKSAIEDLKSLEKELIDIKQDMTETEQATRAIEAEYANAQELSEITENQLQAVKSALQLKSLGKTVVDYLVGFTLGVASSFLASVLYTVWQRHRASR